MASKSDKEKKPSGKTNSVSGKESSKKESTKPKKQLEEDDDDDNMEDEELDTSSSKKKSAVSSKKGKQDDDEEDEGEGEDAVDDWDKVEEEEEWDPDFEEFDLPKSKGKKSGGSGVGKKGLEEEEEFKLDDEFKDMGLFNESNFDDEEDDF